MSWALCSFPFYSRGHEGGPLLARRDIHPTDDTASRKTRLGSCLVMSKSDLGYATTDPVMTSGVVRSGLTLVLQMKASLLSPLTARERLSCECPEQILRVMHRMHLIRLLQ